MCKDVTRTRMMRILASPLWSVQTVQQILIVIITTTITLCISRHTLQIPTQHIALIPTRHIQAPIHTVFLQPTIVTILNQPRTATTHNLQHIAHTIHMDIITVTGIKEGQMVS